MATTAERNAAVDAINASGVIKPGMLTNAETLQLADAVLAVAEAKPTINPGTVISLLMAHSDDIQQIITKLGGLGNIMAIMPNLLSLWNNALDHAQEAAANGGNPVQAITDFQDAARGAVRRRSPQQE